MATVHISSEDLHQLRFGASPLLELIISFKLICLQKPMPYPYQNWRESAREALYGADMSYIADMLAVGFLMPDFITPAPRGMAPNIYDEFARVQATPDTVVQAQIQDLIAYGGITEIRQRFLTQPRESVGMLIAQMEYYWQNALAPHWNNIQSVLEGDVLYRARKQAIEGAEAVFDQLHPGVSLEGNTISLNMHRHTKQLETKGYGILLMPTFFAGKGILYQNEEGAPFMLAYGARGLGNFQPPQASDPLDNGLEIALGAGRAQVLQNLHTPSSTSELASRLSVTAGAVSQHLSKLQQAGLVEPHRSGKRVYYHLTTRGAQLLTVFDTDY